MAVKRTRKESLLRCLKIWQCVVDNNFEDKIDAYVELGFSIPRSYALCPACSYNNTHGDVYCQGDCIVDWGYSHCQYYDSPYNGWELSDNPETRLKYAKQVLARIKLSLKKLED